MSSDTLLREIRQHHYEYHEHGDRQISWNEWLVITEKFPLEAMMAQATEALQRNGGVVAVIGARQSNVGKDLWSNPRCAFLDGKDAVKRGLPKNTRAVVFTKWIGHQEFESVMEQARRRDLAIFPMQGTGQLKVTLSTLLFGPPPQAEGPPLLPSSEGVAWTPSTVSVPPSEAPSEATAPADPPTVTTYPRGTVAAWVRDRYVPGMIFEEMVQASKDEGYHFSLSSLNSAFYSYQRHLRAQAATRAPEVTTRAPEAAAPAEAAVPPSAPVEEPVASVLPVFAAHVQKVEDSGYDVIRLIDDAVAAMQLLREGVQRLVSEKERMVTDHAKMAKVIAMVQELGLGR